MDSEDFEIELTEGIPEDPTLRIIDNQLILINSLYDVDLSGLYDLWNEHKIKVISQAMQIIIKKQKEIMKK